VELARGELARTTGALMGKADSQIQRAEAMLDRARQTVRGAAELTRSVRITAGRYRFILATAATSAALLLTVYRMVRRQPSRTARGGRR
jgi:hypothetical protein